MAHSFEPQEVKELYRLLDELEHLIRLRAPKGELVDMILELRNQITQTLAVGVECPR